MKFFKRAAFIALSVLSAFSVAPVWAAKVVSVSPQGEVAQVRQFVVKFDEAVVRFGDPKAPAPFTLSCNDAAASKGNGRWTNEKEWVYELDQELPAGTRCSLTPVSGGQSSYTARITNGNSYAFNSGGPYVKSIRPSGGEIDENQVFALRLSGAADPKSLEGKIWCQAEGLGESIPVKYLQGKERDGLFKSLGWENVAAEAPLQYLALQCNRRLSEKASVSLVYGKGISTLPVGGQAGVPNSVEKRFHYRVRELFAASFSCERENAQSACLPNRPMTLRFNAPITRKFAEGIVLKSGATNIKAQIADEEGGNFPEDQVGSLQFNPPLPEDKEFRIELPAGLTDTAGRTLRNADQFPLKTRTASMPPLAKFAHEHFGVLERYAEQGVGIRKSQALLPITLRDVEWMLPIRAHSPNGANTQKPQAPKQAAAQVSDLLVLEDTQIIRWLYRVQQGDRENPLLPKDLPTQVISLDRSAAAAQGKPRPFEVVGIPLSPGFHVVEIASKKLGASLLDEKLGKDRTMYVRTSALVTNLGVHFKLGRENALAWVTTLDKAQPVAGAQVRVSNCEGNLVQSGITDAQGLVKLNGIAPDAPSCNDGRGYFVSARHTAPDGVADMAFTWSHWQKGIEPWRFNLNTSMQAQADSVHHTVLDRSLFRAGETVNMRHLARLLTGTGFALPEANVLPEELIVTHLGSGQEFKQNLTWKKQSNTVLSTSSFAIPAAAKLGVYQVSLRLGNDNRNTSGTRVSSAQFRVEEFRLPVLEGSVQPSSKAVLVSPEELPAQVQINYVAGGAASNLPVRVSAVVRGKYVYYSDYPEYQFGDNREYQRESEEESNNRGFKLIADKLPITLNKTGAGTVTIANIPQRSFPQELLLEASYSDPNGEVQTLRSSHTVWPSALVPGIRTEGWASSGQKIKFQALALDTSGKAKPDAKLSVQAVARITTTTRKRMVGGYYSYDNKTETKDLGKVCEGKSDIRGLLLCETTLTQDGEIELIVTATDEQGNAAQAASSVWVTKQGELWFGGNDHDRIDLLPEKKAYKAGDTAKLQVRMPFRQATALVTLEREGIISQRIVQLSGQDPNIEVKIEEGHTPNVFVSALVLRGRIHDVPWYSFFTWGYSAPRQWWNAFWVDGKEYTAPTAMVDLSKPAFRMGTAELKVSSKAHSLDVKVSADKEKYSVRGQAVVSIQATLPDGKPAANAIVSIAAVDQALLELSPNPTWNVLDAMQQLRPWGVETSTAQMQIIGRRHFGQKAVPAGGGGGGRSATRELLDTLLLWQPHVQLDANGKAQITVSLNDAISSFKIVAVAEHGVQRFGTGQTTIRTSQDLQIISGLPPLVREGDEFRAQITLRNSTEKAMKVQVSPRAALLDLKEQTIEIAANSAKEVAWNVTAPAALAFTRQEALLWEMEAKDLNGVGKEAAKDALKIRQKIIPAVPLTVRQATLVQVDGNYSLEAQAPAESLAGRGGLKLSLMPRLADGLPGVRDYFANYAFACLEQKTSKSLGLRDAALWQITAAQLPNYLDADGLASYFPPRNGDVNFGSDTLTAYLLAVTHEVSGLNTAFVIPDASRSKMEAGLVAFVEGKIARDFWSPQKDLDIRKLAALEALSRYGKAQAKMIGSITIAPNQWPTHAVIDWLQILRRVSDIPKRDERLAEAQQILRSRLSYQGTKLIFSTERGDYWWWHMQSGDVNTARLLLAVLQDPAWKDDIPRIASGFIARQQYGAWHTTVANMWGGLALEKFSAAFESAPVAGTTKAQLGANAAQVDWAKVERIKADPPAGSTNQRSWYSYWYGAPPVPDSYKNNSMNLPWNADPAKPSTLSVTHQGSGKPWLTLQSIAAVASKESFNAGYQVKKTITPVEQAKAGVYSRGDVLRVSLEVIASSDMTWVALTDPIPGGATILGGGLGRDSEIATSGEQYKQGAWPSFEERSFESFRAYYRYVRKGNFTLEYTIRLNNAGDFALPATRVEAMYAPEMFGELPNARMKVLAAQ